MHFCVCAVAVNLVEGIELHTILLPAKDQAAQTSLLCTISRPTCVCSERGGGH